jgi:environmental stress-induced protein Ves
MPWRNGLGTTTELARQNAPNADAGQPDFIWRISRADVISSGPFSNFTGVDRTLFLISGNGFTLNFATNEKRVLSQLYQSIQFSGDEPTSCTLLNGPCQDLNIMVSRAHASARTILHHATARCIAGEQTILHALEGAWILAIDGSTYSIDINNMAILTDEVNAGFTIEGSGSLLQVDIQPTSSPDK